MKNAHMLIDSGENGIWLIINGVCTCIYKSSKSLYKDEWKSVSVFVSE